MDNQIKMNVVPAEDNNFYVVSVTYGSQTVYLKHEVLITHDDLYLNSGAGAVIKVIEELNQRGK